jgi:glycosyltransferase involved in cell wall biosynthesis
MQKNFSILITTKNRLSDLKITLQKINYLLERNDVQCIICDDGSTDETSQFVTEQYPFIQLIRNEKSLGLIASRNKLLDMVLAPFAISLDDDLHFITTNPLEIIEKYFTQNKDVAVTSFRIFWSPLEPKTTTTNDKSMQVKSFAGGAHAFRMAAWKTIPKYPEWFVFYGEEDFASFQLYKKKWQVHYLPEILVNHRVDLKSRKKNSDYQTRLRRSLRSGWYLYFLFLPISKIPNSIIYSVWAQLNQKVFKGDFLALKALFFAIFDVLKAFPKIIKNSNRLTQVEYDAYQNLENAQIYWKPENEK